MCLTLWKIVRMPFPNPRLPDGGRQLARLKWGGCKELWLKWGGRRWEVLWNETTLRGSNLVFAVTVMTVIAIVVAIVPLKGTCFVFLCLPAIKCLVVYVYVTITTITLSCFLINQRLLHCGRWLHWMGTQSLATWQSHSCALCTSPQEWQARFWANPHWISSGNAVLAACHPHPWGSCSIVSQGRHICFPAQTFRDWVWQCLQWCDVLPLLDGASGAHSTLVFQGAIPCHRAEDVLCRCVHRPDAPRTVARCCHPHGDKCEAVGEDICPKLKEQSGTGCTTHACNLQESGEPRHVASLQQYGCTWRL